MDERREFVRVSCRLEVETKAGRNWFIINSKNIGMDGMMLTCESDVEKLRKLGIDIERKVYLLFYLPNQADIVKVSGRIVHVKRKANPIDASEASFIGVQFKDVSDRTEKQLEDFILNKKKNLFI